MKAGDVHGRLTAVRPDVGRKWVFSCECGNETSVNKYGVKGGHTRSCGCLHADRCKSGQNRTRHGDACVGKIARLFTIWRGIKARCKPGSTNGHAYKWYAGRGIGLCSEWMSYPVFKDWALTNGYADHLSIDRIDADKGYSPDNCRWADCKAQANNRTSSHFITIGDERKTIAEWAESKGIRYGLITMRLYRGWDGPRAVLTPPHPIKNWRIPVAA